MIYGNIFPSSANSPFGGATAVTAGVIGLVPAPAAGQQNLFLRGDGSWATAGGGSFSPTAVLYVAKNGDDSGGDGTFSNPYLTIQAAVTAAPNNSVVFIFPGTYTENISITSKSNVVLEAFGYFDSPVKISGNIAISGGSGIILKNIEVNETDEPALTLTNTGLGRFVNCLFRRFSADTDDVITVSGTYAGNNRFEGGFIQGTVRNSTTSGSPLYITGMSSGSCLLNSDSAGAFTYIENSPVIGRITHSNGGIIVTNVRTIVSVSGVSINSKANAGGINFLGLANVGLLQDNLTYGTFTQSGTVAYAFNNVNFDQSTSLSGTRVALTAFATQIDANRTPVNYSVTDSTVTAHLAGIDDALTAAGLSWSVASSNTTLTANTGYITDGAAEIVYTLPATAAVGAVFKVVGRSADGWRVNQNAGQIIHLGNTTTTTGNTGYINSTNAKDSIELVCVNADTEFVISASVGLIELT